MPKDKKRKKLRNLILNEVAFVDAGANQHAHIVLMKRAQKEELLEHILKELKAQGISSELCERFAKEAHTFKELLNAREAQQDLWQVLDVLHESIFSVLNDSEIDAKEEVIGQSLDEFNTAIRAVLSELTKSGGTTMPIDNTDLQKKVDELTALITSLQEKLEEQTKKSTETEDALKKQLEDWKAEHSEELDEHGNSIKKSKDDDVDDDNDDLIKLPEAVTKQLEELEELKKRNEASEVRIKKMEEEAAHRDIVAKVKAEYPNVPGEEDALVGLYKAVSKESEEQLKTLETLLKSLDEATQQLLKISGKDTRTTEDTDGSAVADLEKKAEEIARRDGITVEKAFVTALNEYPELAKREREERTALVAK